MMETLDFFFRSSGSRLSEAKQPYFRPETSFVAMFEGVKIGAGEGLISINISLDSVSVHWIMPQIIQVDRFSLDAAPA
jgi:hypothetical protein